MYLPQRITHKNGGSSWCGGDFAEASDAVSTWQCEWAHKYCWVGLLASQARTIVDVGSRIAASCRCRCWLEGPGGPHGRESPSTSTPTTITTLSIYSLPQSGIKSSACNVWYWAISCYVFLSQLPELPVNFALIISYLSTNTNLVWYQDFLSIKI